MTVSRYHSAVTRHLEFLIFRYYRERLILRARKRIGPAFTLEVEARPIPPKT